MDEGNGDQAAELYAVFPLQSHRQTRVIDIRPARSFHEPIRAKMRVLNIPKVPEHARFLSSTHDHERYRQQSGVQTYQALSYAWGSPRKDQTIIISDLRLMVTTNLNNALKRFRERMSKDIFLSTLWIDAISIDQADLEERSRQVSMMGDIYLLAKETTIWLGEANDEEVFAFETKHRPALVRASQALWFRRRWVLQEILLSNRSMRSVQYGRLRQPYEAFCTLLSIHLPTAVKADTPILQLSIEFDLQRRGAYDAGKDYRRGPEGLPDLLYNLLRCRETECSDAHDRIYALLGISRPPFAMSVDYSRSVRGVYMEIAKFYLQEDPTRVMAMATTTSHPLDCGLPSWIPNWQDPGPAKTPQHKACIERMARRDLRHGDVARAVVNPDDHALLVQGWVFEKCPHTPKDKPDCICCILLSAGPFGNFDNIWKLPFEEPWTDPVEGERLLWVKGSQYGFVVRDQEGRQESRLVSCFDASIYRDMTEALERMERLVPCGTIRIV